MRTLPISYYLSLIEMAFQFGAIAEHSNWMRQKYRKLPRAVRASFERKKTRGRALAVSSGKIRSMYFTSPVAQVGQSIHMRKCENQKRDQSTDYSRSS
jgi:hypothetical protein